MAEHELEPPAVAGPGAEGERASKSTREQHTPPVRWWTKRRRVLHYMARGGSLNRFEAVGHLHDWVLPSTVSAITAQYGITVDRRSETVRGYMGAPTTTTRYWLSSEEQRAALNALAREADTAGLAETANILRQRTDEGGGA
ncbi:hypothetical protein [Arhodomonas sp. SL1]|uniref:hypothetical protein n=1 Tax=Arhodomonas sp. SL1 TaxID=3425691 RepID=UPI003F88184D